MGVTLARGPFLVPKRMSREGFEGRDGLWSRFETKLTPGSTPVGTLSAPSLKKIEFVIVE